jgi:hypothetical protein
MSAIESLKRRRNEERTHFICDHDGFESGVYCLIYKVIVQRGLKSCLRTLTSIGRSSLDPSYSKEGLTPTRVYRVVHPPNPRTHVMATVWGLLGPVAKVMAASPIPRRALRTAPQPADEHADLNDLEFHFIKSQGEDLGIGAQGKVTAAYNDQCEVGPSHSKLHCFSDKMVEVSCMQDDQLSAGEQTSERC